MQLGSVMTGTAPASRQLLCQGQELWAWLWDSRHSQTLGETLLRFSRCLFEFISSPWIGRDMPCAGSSLLQVLSVLEFRCSLPCQKRKWSLRGSQ